MPLTRNLLLEGGEVRKKWIVSTINSMNDNMQIYIMVGADTKVLV